MDFDNNLSPVEPKSCKGSCISNILPSVVLCTTLKPNGKFPGNLWVQQRQRRNPTPQVDLGSLLSGYLYLAVLNSAQSSRNNWKFHEFLLTYSGVESHCNANGVLEDL